jgi:SAM-dependent methyltransferase
VTVDVPGREGHLRRAIRHAVPKRVRRPVGSAAFRAWRPVREAPARLPELLGRVPILAVRDLVYDDGFYDRADPEPAALYDRIVDVLVELCSPKSVVDVGCGSGIMLTRFAQHGVEVRGVEGSRAAIRRSGLADRIVRANLERGVPDLGRFDLCVCVEVAEHLRPGAAPSLVAGLARLSDVVLFTAASPGQPGVAHINLRPQSYWSELFARHGLARDRLEREVRSASATVPEPAYIHANLMVFERAR